MGDDVLPLVPHFISVLKLALVEWLAVQGSPLSPRPRTSVASPRCPESFFGVNPLQIRVPVTQPHPLSLPPLLADHARTLNQGQHVHSNIPVTLEG